MEDQPGNRNFVYATNAKGVSAINMCRLVGVSYKTAFILMHKLREAIMVSVDASLLIGEVHVDGGHVGGKVRKANKKADRQKRQQRDRIPDVVSQFHPNRRITMVARSVEKGSGAVRTVVSQVTQETASNVLPFVKRTVKHGARIHTDELSAYTALGAVYDHHTVNHSEEFQTDNGVNNNQAESFFTRHKRMIIGQLHRMTPKYMCDYAHETAWREDTRRNTDRRLVERLLEVALRSGTSVFWRGYHQGHHRQDEIVFPTTVEDAIEITKVHAEEHTNQQAVMNELKRTDLAAWEQWKTQKYFGDLIADLRAGKTPRRRAPKLTLRSPVWDG